MASRWRRCGVLIVHFETFQSKKQSDISKESTRKLLSNYKTLQKQTKANVSRTIINSLSLLWPDHLITSGHSVVSLEGRNSNLLLLLLAK